VLASPRVLYQGVPHPAVDMRASAAAAAQHSADQAMLSQSRGTAGAPPSRSNSPTKTRLEDVVAKGLSSSGAAVDQQQQGPANLQALYSQINESQSAAPYLPGRARFTPVAGYRAPPPPSFVQYY